MILNFILGGLLFSIIHFVVNTLNNTALGAMISMIPIGFLSTYIIKNRNLLLQYIRNIIFVIIGTLCISIIFYLVLKYLPDVNRKIIITFILLLWLVIQLCNYRFNIYKDESNIVFDTDISPVKEVKKI
jgi:glucan phosphoethanolaminetransferase (alkaline phosphatase superfamily)